MTAPTERTERDPVVRIVDWMKRNQKPLIVAAAVVVGTIAVVMYMRLASERRESFATSLLTNARAVAAAGNPALAITDLSELVISHRGTIAAEEAEISGIDDDDVDFVPSDFLGDHSCFPKIQA